MAISWERKKIPKALVLQSKVIKKNIQYMTLLPNKNFKISFLVAVSRWPPKIQHATIWYTFVRTQ